MKHVSADLKDCMNYISESNGFSRLNHIVSSYCLQWRLLAWSRNFYQIGFFPSTYFVLFTTLLLPHY